MKLILLILVVCVQLSCKEAKQKKSTSSQKQPAQFNEISSGSGFDARPNGAFLSESQMLPPQNLTIDDRETFLTDINGEEFFIKADIPDSEKSCPGLNNIKFQVSGNKAIAAGSTTDSSCFMSDSSSATFSDTNLRVFIYIACENSNLSNLKDKSAESIDLDLVCGSEQDVAFLQNVSSSMTVSFDDGSGKTVSTSLTVNETTQTFNGKACVTQSQGANRFLNNNCSKKHTTIYTDQSYDSQFRELSSNNLLSEKNGYYFSGGEVKFTLNNWTGNMVYTSSSKSTPPQFTARSRNGESISGTYKPSFGPNLHLNASSNSKYKPRQAPIIKIKR